jgi:hypothetical protein
MFDDAEQPKIGPPEPLPVGQGEESGDRHDG